MLGIDHFTSRLGVFAILLKIIVASYFVHSLGLRASWRMMDHFNPGPGVRNRLLRTHPETLRVLTRKLPLDVVQASRLMISEPRAPSVFVRFGFLV